MSKRTWLMGGAVALAVVVMALAWLAGAGSTGQSGQKDHARPQSETIDPNWDPGKFDTHATGQGDMKQMLQGAGKTQFTRRNEKGQLEVYRGDPITPLPGGWWQVGKPEFIDYLAKDRALRLTADTGKLFAPAEPRAGQLLGQVKIEYFDARDPNKKVDIASDSPDLRFRMLMQDVNFDRDLFRLETDGPFHMTGPDFDFVGEHLKLVYSDAQRRIETLQVQKSKWLRIHPQPKQPKVTPQPGTQPASTQPVTTQPATTQPDKPARPIQYYRAVFPLNVRITSPQVQVACEELELIFSLQNDEGGQSKMFQKFSSLSPGQSPQTAQVVTPQLLAAMLQTGGSPLNQAMAQLVSWSMTQVDDKGASTSRPSVSGFGDGSLQGAASYFKTQSLAPSSDQDIVITWDGPLAVEPIEPKVAMAGAQDVYVKMIGRPVRVTGERGEIVKSATLSYLVSQQKLTLLGDGAYPVSLDSPQLGGVLQADNFTLDQIHGTGHVDGPGVLRASNTILVDGLATPGQALATSGHDRLPAGFSIGWKDALALTFYKRQNQPTANTGRRAGLDPFKGNPVQITALKTASFQGDVTVAHPSFNVISDQLNMVMGLPGQGKQSLEHINATGHVRVGVHGQSPSQQANITCHDLAIELGTNAQGKVEPQRLVATTDVQATTVQGTLKTPRLTAVLNPRDLFKSESDGNPKTLETARVYVLAPENTTAEAPGMTSEPSPLAVTASAFTDLMLPSWWSSQAEDFSATTQPAPPLLAVLPQRKERQPLKQLIAENPVDIQMHDPAMHIVASRLVTDFGPTETQIQLFGTQASPVSVERQGVTMTGQRLVFARNARTLHIPGAGTMTFLSQEPVKMASTSQPAVALAAVAPATKVTVNWTQAMHFDDRDATAQFLGDVQVRGAKGTESTLLNCEDLRLAFIRKDESSFGQTAATSGVSGDSGATSQPVTADKQAAMLRKVRQVRNVTARNHVVFEAQDQGSNPPGHRPDTRVRIVGELMTFEGATQQVQVIGPGTMLLEDYRKTKAKAPQENAPKTAVLPDTQAPRAMVGRGATAFRWQGSMLLDASVNDMILEKNVQMIYAPIDDNQRFQLDCSHLVTDLQDTGGLGSVTSASTPKIKAVFADENVRLLTGDKQITTDHLEYDGSKELVLLTADTGKYTTISDAKTPVPLTFHQVKWFLRNNRFEGIAPGRGVVPLIQDSRRK